MNRRSQKQIKVTISGVKVTISGVDGMKKIGLLTETRIYPESNLAITASAANDAVKCLRAHNLSANIHRVQKKTPTCVFDYNSSVSWSIFIISVPVEREMNTLQFTYLQS